MRVFSYCGRGAKAVGLVRESVGAGVSEMREHFGPGWRMYYVQRGDVLIVMLGGGDKPTPQSDEDIANYLTAVLEENDPDELPHALGVIARARRMQLTARPLHS